MISAGWETHQLATSGTFSLRCFLFLWIRYPTTPAMASAPPTPPPTPPPIAAAFDLSGSALPVTGGSVDVVAGSVVSFGTENVTGELLDVLLVDFTEVDVAVPVSSDAAGVGLDVDAAEDFVVAPVVTVTSGEAVRSALYISPELMLQPYDVYSPFRLLIVLIVRSTVEQY
jgi:hypothetical protein